ncbi:MAG TPA: hypothetical protein VFI24_04510 [Pyrinomonadaceae bacterium]|nr:hypothetical protein [Pyrinomonadaceae bacterium]
MNSKSATPTDEPIIQPLTEKQSLAPQRAGYYETVWPSEHTDLWRSHAVSGVGLPADFDPTKLTVTTANLNLPVWGYTRAKDEVFVIGGSPCMLNIFTQMIKNGGAGNTAENTLATLSEANIRASAEDRKHSVPYVAKINPLTMAVTQLDLTEGDTINYTGGLLMHENGFVYGVSRSVLYKVDPEKMQVIASAPLPLVGTSKEQNYWTTYNGLQVVASGELVIKGFYFLDSVSVNGWLLLVDPDTLQIDVQQSEALSSARLTIQQASDGSAILYQVNATQSLRFEITDAGFVLDNAWTRTYRTESDGTTQASSPLLFGKVGQVVFADNTAPGATTPINLYDQPVNVDALPANLEGINAFDSDLPSFNFFMVAGDPFERQILFYYDPINNLIGAHTVLADGTLERLWEINDVYKVSASPAVVPDRDLLYIDDYQNGIDSLIVLRLSTGEELARVPLAANLPTIGTIFLGMNEDVYILSSEAGSDNGLISRIFMA